MREPTTIKDIVTHLVQVEKMRCFCDLDNWEPEHDTGHSHVCPIHKTAKARYEQRPTTEADDE